MIDPAARALVDLIESKGIPPTHTLTPTQARAMYRERRAVTQPDPPPVAALREHVLPGGLRLREYRPIGTAELERAPALVYFHGGGWTIGDLDSHDVLCRQVANGSGCCVFAVDYRLGPEHRFPAAVDDAIAATRWVASEAASLSIDASRLAVGGDSAGGNLAAVVAIAARDAGDLPLAYQMLVYPATDMRCVAPSHQLNGQGYLLTADTIRWFRDHYIDRRAHYDDWRASPLLSQDLSRLPPALIVTAGFDPLRDEGLQYADRLAAAGGVVTSVCFDRQIHGFITMGRVIAEANTAVVLCAAELQRALA